MTPTNFANPGCASNEQGDWPEREIRRRIRGLGLGERGHRRRCLGVQSPRQLLYSTRSGFALVVREAGRNEGGAEIRSESQYSFAGRFQDRRFRQVQAQSSEANASWSLHHCAIPYVDERECVLLDRHVGEPPQFAFGGGCCDVSAITVTPATINSDNGSRTSLRACFFFSGFWDTSTTAGRLLCSSLS